MKTEEQTSVSSQQASSGTERKPGMLTDIQASKPQKRKHNSALLAASRYRSPVHHVSSNTYFNTSLEDTGLNIGFRERGDIT